MDLLFVIFLVALFVWILKPIFRVWLAIRQARKQARDIFGAGGFGSARDTNPFAGTGPAPKPHHRGKIITEDIGEYVEFEEIHTVTHDYTSGETDTETSTRTTVAVESQIEDADWEDIK